MPPPPSSTLPPPPKIKVTTLSHTFTHPSSSTPPPFFPEPKTVNLGIPDNATASYSPPQAIWFYDAPDPPTTTSREKDRIFSPTLLLRSLSLTLCAYPHFAGRLERIPYRPHGAWTERHGRLRVVYGTPRDPGVESFVARCEGGTRLEDVVPDAEGRGKVWDASGVPFGLFSGEEGRLAMQDGGDGAGAGLPAAIVKITTFACGGVAIAARLQHVLGDAQAFLRFVHDWAGVHRSLVGGKPLPALEPVFDPAVLDGLAAGDVDAEEPDEGILARAGELQVHRYDWWASGGEDCPEGFRAKTMPAPELMETVAASGGVPGGGGYGRPIPWKDWDVSTPTPHYVLHYTAEEIERMYRAVCIPAPSSSTTTPEEGELRFSRLDALLAHLWSAIVRARNIPAPEDIYLEFAFNFRRRMRPPLPDTLLGVPACMVHAKTLAQHALAGNVRALATAIRSTIGSMEREGSIPALLHEWAHDVDAQRKWQFVGGRHHVTVTSWLQHRMCEVDFWGRGRRPRFVEAMMPGWIVQVMESRYGDVVDKEEEDGVDGVDGGAGRKEQQQQQEQQRPWYSSGVDISFNLEREVVERLVKEPLC
ncbi:MAG: hypothetical protein Q9219_004845 [cf. Caloplaca sp. 3 TL-2023]